MDLRTGPPAGGYSVPSFDDANLSLIHSTAFQVLTFDCYGTLIDWESGILDSLRPVLSAHGVAISDEEALALYARLEAEAERGAYRPYRAVLEEVVRGFGRRLGFEPTGNQTGCLVDAFESWPPFPDTVAALRRLGSRYRLAVISNVDEDLFRLTAPALEIDFDRVITAQKAGAYKPDPEPFRVALRELGVPREAILHVAQSLYHDIRPAKDLGLPCVWVNRRLGKPSSGVTPAPASRDEPDFMSGMAARDERRSPDWEVPDLASLVSRLGLD